jgi:hypothetical protein
MEARFCCSAPAARRCVFLGVGFFLKSQINTSGGRKKRSHVINLNFGNRMDYFVAHDLISGFCSGT